MSETLTFVLAQAITILLAYFAYWSGRRKELELARWKEQLNLINERMSKFYGPLYVSSDAGTKAFEALQLRLFSGESDILSPAQQEEWRIWVKEVFMPLNIAREEIILQNAYLIREEETPECLLTFMAHVSSYKGLLKKWEVGDFSEQFPIIRFPKELDTYARTSYHELKNEQLRLIGLLKVEGQTRRI
jgi:hypothetical protein